MIDRMQQQSDDTDFHHRMEIFLQRWQPRSHRDAIDFHAELYTLIRLLYREAQEPLARQIVALCARMPVLPFNKE